MASVAGMTSYTNQLDKVTRYAYDAVGRKTFETNANSAGLQPRTTQNTRRDFR